MFCRSFVLSTVHKISGMFNIFKITVSFNTHFCSSIHLFKNLFGFLSDEGPMLETLDYTIRIGSTPTFLYFDLYLYSAYAAHFVNFTFLKDCYGDRKLRLPNVISVVIIIESYLLLKSWEVSKTTPKESFCLYGFTLDLSTI